MKFMQCVKKYSVLMCFFAIVMSTSLVAKEAVSQTGNSEKKAIFAGGCFWCMEPPFDKIDGVISTTSGYTGGNVEDPSYQEVSAGTTGHAEVVEIVFDPDKVSYADLLKVFWKNIDPTTADGQFCDGGNQYRSGIFYIGDQQKQAAEKSLAMLMKTKPFPESIVTKIVKASVFYPAEGYHQDYYQNHSISYKFYRRLCGRDSRLEELWGKS